MKRLFLGLIWFYQHVISPIIPRSCRYKPTCSEYARRAFKRHGVLRGLYLSITRIGSCHPLGSRPMWDPVPEEPPF